ncbi:sodium/proline symporter [Bacteriovoracaceae bacterium]|nr:sodium/proline symporter [Bacteriovoracaceae bacterium]
MSNIVVTTSFIFFLISFVIVGILATFKKKNSAGDYYLAGQSVGVWPTALSIIASSNSGFMFVGLIGEAYSNGISCLWLMGGWIFGDYLTWMLGLQKKLRLHLKGDFLTVPALVSKGNLPLRQMLSLIVIIFLGLYAAAQLAAGSKSLGVLFGLDYTTGIFLGATVVGLYCFAGGIRASIWTDVIQCIVMFLGMFLLLGTAIYQIGGFEQLITSLSSIDPQLINWYPVDAKYGLFLFLLGWICTGMGTIGQPHIIIRSLAIKNPTELDKAKNICVLWNAVFAIGTIAIGLTARVLLPKSGIDPEMAMPLLAQMLLPDILVGMMLASLFAAIISTADSLILSCSASLTHDLIPKMEKTMKGVKTGTILVLVISMVLAIFDSNVFALVTFSWSMMATSLSPLIIAKAFGFRLPEKYLLLMVSLGPISALTWRSFELHTIIAETFIGFLVSALLFLFAILPQLNKQKLIKELP